MNSVYFVHVHTYRMAQHIFEFVWVSPISPTPICLLPFHLLNIKLCHFAYFFLMLRQTSQQLNLPFQQQGVKGCFFHFAQALNRRISTLGLLLYTRPLHQFVVPLICITSLGAANVTAPNLPRVDEFCNML